MSLPLAIVAMDLWVNGESGIDSFDQRVYDGLSLVDQHNPSTLSEAGFVEFLEELLQRAGEKPSATQVVLVAPEFDASTLSGFKSLVVCASLAEAVDQATSTVDKGEAVLIASYFMPNSEKTEKVNEEKSISTMAFDVDVSLATQRYQQSSVAAAVVFRKEGSGSAEPLAYLLAHSFGDDVAATCQQALNSAKVSSCEIEYIDVTASDQPVLNQKELVGLIEEYGRESKSLDCALGSVSANIGVCGAVTEFASFIKTVMSLHHRYIPAVPNWNAPAESESWENSPFYVATESTHWFENKSYGIRKAAVSSVSERGVAHFILGDNAAATSDHRTNQYLSRVSWSFFPISGNTQAELVANLQQLAQEIEQPKFTDVAELKALAKHYFIRHNDSQVSASYSLVILGENQEILLKEVALIQAGLETAFDTMSERKTPKGSFFTPTPVGPEAEVAFVYPGIGAPYVDFGRDLFHLFPSATSFLNTMSRDAGKSVKQDLLYPRSRHRLDPKQKKAVEKELKVNLHKISECGVGMGYLLTKAFREQFKLEPNAGVGYSMGEVSMYVALDAWADAGCLSEPLADHPTFKHNITGELHALKEYWSMQNSSKTGTELWNTYSLRGDPENVAKVVEGEERVFLTIINTPDNMLIGGDPDGCQRVIKALGTRAMSLQLASAIHSAPAKLEYDRIVDLYSIEVNDRSAVRYYSTSVYKPVPHRTKAIANSIAKSFTEPVDFPKLIQTMVDSGVKVFVEMGADRSCSTWIDKIVKHSKDNVPHVCVPVNAKGTDDHITLVRALAKLVSHKVKLDISSLYAE